MNLLFVHDHKFHMDKNGNFYSGGGLPSLVWKRYLNFFDKITVLGRDGGAIEEDLVMSSCQNVAFYLLNKPVILPVSKQVKKHIEKLVVRNDILIARLPSELGLTAINLAVKNGKPYVIELVDCPWDALWNHGQFLRKLYAPILYLKIKKAAKNTKYIHYVTKIFLQKRYPTNAKKILCCSNVQLPSSCENILDSRKIKIITEKDITVGLIGSLNGKLKGIHIAIKSIALLKNKYPSITLKILGKGNELNHLRLAEKYGVSDNIVFDGVVESGKEVFNWLDNISIYIHPSYKEGLPRALLEAMSRGCPCVGSSIAGIPELLESPFLIEPGNFNELAFKIDDLLSNEEKMIEAAQKNINTSYAYKEDVLIAKRASFWNSVFKDLKKVSSDE